MDAAGAAILDDAGVAERLREAGYRVTRPRLVVYRVLRNLRGHRSADDVYAALRKSGSAIPRQSVYNAIEALHAAGAGRVRAAAARARRARRS